MRVSWFEYHLINNPDFQSQTDQRQCGWPQKVTVTTNAKPRIGSTHQSFPRFLALHVGERSAAEEDVPGDRIKDRQTK